MGAIRRHGLIGGRAKCARALPLPPRRARSSRSRRAWPTASWPRASPPSACTWCRTRATSTCSTPGRKDAALVERFGLSDKFVVGYAGAIGPSNEVEGNVPASGAHPARARPRRHRVPHRRRRQVAARARGRGARTCPTSGSPAAMPKAEVPRFTRTADALMVLFADKPILATNSPNKFFDGLASGKPMIVNSAGWTRELVEEHRAGRYFPAGDGVALADSDRGAGRRPRRCVPDGRQRPRRWPRAASRATSWPSRCSGAREPPPSRRARNGTAQTAASRPDVKDVAS